MLDAVVEGGGETGSMACAFDVSVLTYDGSLDPSPSAAPSDTSYQYASLADYVWAAKAAGPRR